jgi:hypothetical protein
MSRESKKPRLWLVLAALAATTLIRAPGAALAQAASGVAPAPAGKSAPPRVFLLDANRLEASKQRIVSHDPAVSGPLEQLQRDAKRALGAGPFSVVDKDATPPSGDKHDYMSQAPYFWPDPNTAGGLPYIRRDGERNPEINKFRNHQAMSRMADAVDVLALAYYLTADEQYAAKASQLLRGWFLEPATKMNPNLQFAQAIPGVNSGRGIGLIESICLTRVVDDVGLLHGSKAWTADDQRGMEEWFDAFLQWMRESKNGKDEAAAKNNHGTYYDLQVASYAFFLGQDDLAKSVLERVGPQRIATQVEPDGREPLELVRTKAWSYSIGNLSGLMSLARLGEHVDVDLWNYRTADGRSIRQAVDFLASYAAGEKKWDYQQLGGWMPESFAAILRRAAAKYPDGRYAAVLQKLSQDRANSWRDSLL